VFDDDESPLSKIGMTEEQFQAFMRRKMLLGLPRKYTIVLPFGVFHAWKDISQAMHEGEMSQEEGAFEFDVRVRPHFKIPEGYNKERGDIIQFTYEPPVQQIVRASH